MGFPLPLIWTDLTLKLETTGLEWRGETGRGTDNNVELNQNQLKKGKKVGTTEPLDYPVSHLYQTFSCAMCDVVIRSSFYNLHSIISITPARKCSVYFPYGYPDPSM